MDSLLSQFRIPTAEEDKAARMARRKKGTSIRFRPTLQAALREYAEQKGTTVSLLVERFAEAGLAAARQADAEGSGNGNGNGKKKK